MLFICLKLVKSY